MKKAIVYSSVSGNTKLLATQIKGLLTEETYCGKPDDSTLDADFIFVGFWTIAFSCSKDIQEYLAKLNNKKIFLFGTAGYNDTPEFFEGILNSVKTHINDTNEVVGEYMCVGKVSQAKQDAIKNMDEEKFNNMKACLEASLAHPNEDDVVKFKTSIQPYV